jgi:hypothetical protein
MTLYTDEELLKLFERCFDRYEELVPEAIEELALEAIEAARVSGAMPLTEREASIWALGVVEKALHRACREALREICVGP